MIESNSRAFAFDASSVRLSPMRALCDSVPNPPWFERAICTDMDPEVFFPCPSESPQPAKEICRTCPVMNECGAWALEEGIPYGVWGGMSARERSEIHKFRKPEHEMKLPEKQAWKRRYRIAELRKVNTTLTNDEIGKRFGVDSRTIARDMGILRRKGLLPK